MKMAGRPATQQTMMKDDHRSKMQASQMMKMTGHPKWKQSLSRLPSNCVHWVPHRQAPTPANNRTVTRKMNVHMKMTKMQVDDMKQQMWMEPRTKQWLHPHLRIAEHPTGPSEIFADVEEQMGKGRVW